MIKNSVGIWAFGPAVTRFVPPGYHNEVAGEPMVEKTERVADGLHDLLEGLEYHYPGEINEDNAEGVLRVLAAYGMNLPVIAAGLHPDPTYALGAFINPDEGLRRQGIDTLRRGIDLCASVGANFIIWPGAEGYNYTFQRPYAEVWRRFVEGVAELTDHANEKDVKVFLEHKNSEPAMKILMQNIGHQHGNDGWGTFDDDNVVGTNFFMQTLELAQTLQDTGYGEEGEIIGFDLYPYTEDQVSAVRRAILQWEFIWDLAKKIDRAELREAKTRADALAGARAVAVDESGEIVAEASSEYPLHSPRPGWTEQDPEDWWEGANEAIGKVATQTGEQIAGIGLTGQMHGSVFLDSSDEIVR